MQYIQKESRDQITFLPDCIEDYISEENPVRVIDAFVDNLDLPALGFSHSALCEQAVHLTILPIYSNFTSTDI